ncbi:MAG: HPr(Ser) kinase/phosphatase, partial [Methylibium petroleiphilum]
TVISAEALFEAHRTALRWEWLAGHAHPERRFDEVAVRDAQSAADLVGYLNYIHPYRVQIVGRREVRYLVDVPPEDQERRISRIVTLEPPVVIVADQQTPPDRLVAMCERADIPLFVTEESAGHVIDVLRAHLSQHFADRTTRHGVFMDILGLGVLLTGES